MIDGKKLGGHFPWHVNKGGLLDIATGTVTAFGDGCWGSVTPDNTYRYAAMDLPHRGWDVWDANTTYNKNPFVDPQSDSTRVSTSLISRVQPRVGVSFPVSVNTVFHLNYGSFMQRPSFKYLYQWEPNTRGTGGEFGNPTLEPQVTYMYDVGITQGLGEGFTFDASGYYKNVKDQLEEALYYYNYTYSSDGTPIPGPTYQTYINRDYADIRGFRF